MRLTIKLTSTLILVLLMKISSGQVLFNNTYSKPNFDYSDAVIERHDGKYLIAGSSRSLFATDFDVNILLIDSIGNLIWDKYIGQSPRLEFAYSLIETKDSNYVVVGSVNNSNPYMLKFNSLGNFIWDKEYLSTSWTEGFSVGQTFDGNYFFVRPDTSTTLFVTNPVGDTLWTKRYNFTISQSVVQTFDSGFVMTGNTNPTTTNQEISLVKLNSVGDTSWTKTFGGAGNDGAFSVQQLSDNGYIIAGNFDTQIIDDDWETFIIRTNSVGDTLWTQKYYLGTARYIKECKNNDGYVLSTIKFVTGWFPNPDEFYMVITKLDTLGNIQWSRQFDGNTYSLGNNITQTSDGGYVLTGHIDNGMAMADVVLIKLDSIGNYVLSVSDIISSKFSHVVVFPNPTTSELNFVLGANTARIKQVRVLNSLGQELEVINDINQNQIRVDIRKLNAGLFFYELTTTDNKIETGKFIVKE